MNSLVIETESNTQNGPSPALWADCPWHDLKEGRVADKIGWCDHYDFSKFRPSTNVNAAEAYWADGYMLFGSDGASVAVLDALGGGATFGSDGDNEGVGLRDVGGPFQISRSHGDLWFEVCLRTSTITDTKHGFFVGLTTSTAITATSPIAAAGTLADINFVGFHRLEGDGDQIDIVYKADGQTQVSLKTDALSGSTYRGGTVPSALAADTDIRLGMYFDATGHPKGNSRVLFFVNGIELPDGYNVTATAGNPFPNDVRLGRTFSLLNATASTPGTTSLRWWRAAQLYARN